MNSYNASLDLPDSTIFDTPVELYHTRGLFSKNYINSQKQILTATIDSQSAEVCFANCRKLYESIHSAMRARRGRISEADTEGEFLDKIIPLLGFQFLHRTRQDPGGVPDYVLFADERTKSEAFELADELRYSLAVTFLEAKSFERNLGGISRRETKGLAYSKQVQLYLSDAHRSSGERFFNWAILTNGREWRLYNHLDGRNKFFEMNLHSALNNLDDFKLFLALFGRSAFIQDENRKTLLDRLREEANTRQQELEANLERRIYILMEWVMQGFYDNNFNVKFRDEMDLKRVYTISLIFLYRLMFILYAEARELLPVFTSRRGARVDYRDNYSLARLKERLTDNQFPPEDDVHTTYWHKLLDLFELIEGHNERLNERLKVPRYNGGLFDQKRYPELTRGGWRLGDWTVQETLKRLMYDIRPSSARETIPTDSHETIDYTTLTVQKLGSIYEGLLEHKPEARPDGIRIVSESDERRQTGSYYTPQWVVDYILEETLRPLLNEAENSEAVRNAKEENLEDNSFAAAVLRLKIIDPAMGSGHFLVGATEFLAEEIATHPTTRNIVPQRSGTISEDEAIKAVWKRKVVESCIYGVDKNDLAVELAKLSLWLTCISPVQPLNFLDHHLRCGDSLTGRSRRDVVARYKLTGFNEALQAAETTLNEIIALSSDDWESVQTKKNRFESEVRDRLIPYEALFDRWTERDFAEEIDERQFSQAVEALLAGGGTNARSLAPEQGAPLHFDLAFPDVFPPDGAEGGFDAAVGNPPYVRQERLGALKRYLQRNYVTYDGAADLYVYFVERGFNLLKPGGRFGMIFSNKWMRSGYGITLRQFVKQWHLEQIVDFGELKVFASSSTFPMIMIAKRVDPQATPFYTPVKSLPDGADELTEFVQNDSFRLGKEGMSDAGFALVQKSLTDVFEKMKAAGRPLGEYVEGKIYRGIITGFNEAFVITADQRERLIAKDRKSAEIIVPWVVGDDVRKWRVNYRNRYLILTKIGVEIEEYPAVFEHLQAYQERLENRWDKGDNWWELRACSYYDEFLKPKIVWPDIAKESRFAFDEAGYYYGNTVYFAPISDHFLIGLLNSKAVWAYLIRTAAVLGDPDKGGRIRHFRQYMTSIPTSDNGWKQSVAELARKALGIKDKMNVSPGLAETRRLEAQMQEVEREIDRAVYALYGLNDREIALIERGED